MGNRAGDMIRYKGFKDGPNAHLFTYGDQTFAVKHAPAASPADSSPRAIWRVSDEAQLIAALNHPPLRSVTERRLGEVRTEDALARLLGLQPPSRREVRDLLTLAVSTQGMSETEVYASALACKLIDLPTYDRALEAMEASGQQAPPSADDGIEELGERDGLPCYRADGAMYAVKEWGGSRTIWAVPQYLAVSEAILFLPIRAGFDDSATDKEAVLKLLGKTPPSSYELRNLLSGTVFGGAATRRAWNGRQRDIVDLGLRIGVIDLPTHSRWMTANPDAHF